VSLRGSLCSLVALSPASGVRKHHFDAAQRSRRGVEKQHALGNVPGAGEERAPLINRAPTQSKPKPLYLPVEGRGGAERQCGESVADVRHVHGRLVGCQVRAGQIHLLVTWVGVANWPSARKQSQGAIKIGS
jgi:hypothetical protein